MKTKIKALSILMMMSTLGAHAQGGQNSGDAFLWSTLIILGVLIFALVVMIFMFGDYVYMEYKNSNSRMPWYVSLFGMIRGDFSWVAGETRDVIIEGHDYDGIEEFDNDLPQWWKVGFYITIIFGVGYLLNYHVLNTGNLQEEEFEIAMAKASEMYADVDLVYENAVEDEALLAGIMPEFEKNCGACHTKSGGGNTGPNLTDKYWIYGGDVNTLYETIKYGRKGESVMPAQGAKYSNEQIYHLASYIISLQGSNPEGALDPLETETVIYPEEK